MTDASGTIQHVLEVGGALDLCGDDGAELALAREGAEKTRRQDRVEHAAPLAQDAGEPRRCPHDGGNQLEETRVLLEQGEQLNARGQFGQKPVETEER